MLFSVIIPAHNEDGCIAGTLDALVSTLDREGLPDFEIVVVADHCTDGTEAILSAHAAREPRIRWLRNDGPPGFGMAVRTGLDAYRGEAAALFMADASDSPDDLAVYIRRLAAGAECVFGSRFIRGGRVVDYPPHKLILNRLGNWIIRLLFQHGLNDTTNAFKAYRREVIDGCRPFIAPHFNLSVELPLKAVVRGYRCEVVPISWHNRTSGVSKLKIREMGSRYFFIIFYCLLEKWLTGKDYRRESQTRGAG